MNRCLALFLCSILAFGVWLNAQEPASTTRILRTGRDHSH